MTQSGQGEEPSPRVAREGIVLPSDGGEPLLPGMTGGPGGHQPAPHIPNPTPAPPAGGQAWGTPWGPEQQTPAPQQGDGWGGTPQAQQAQQSQQWGTQDPYQAQAQQWTAQEPQPQQQPQPQQGAPAPGYDADQPTSYYLPPVDQNAPQGGGAPQPPVGHDTDQPTSYYLPPVAQNTPHGGPTGGAYGAPAGGAPLPPATTDGYGAPGGAPLPPAGAYGAPLPPANAYGPPGGAPLPPAADLYGPPVGHGAAGGVPLPPPVNDEGATQYIPPVAAAPSEGVTQYIPPVGPGALPPEVPGAGERTQFLGQAPQAPHAAHGAGPLPPVSGPDAEATQYIAPVPGQHGGERQPPAEFDSLFRSGPGGESPAQATQQLPRFEPGPGVQPQPRGAHPQPAYAQPSYGSHEDDDHGRGGGGGRSRVPLIAGVGIAIAALGIGAGALLSGGGGDDDGDGSKTVSATAPVSESASPSADPVKAQAVELDKLLADSGDSRASVISAVEDVKACKNLPQAAQNLRDAATQRNELVTRLSGLTVDQLPNHTELTTALTKAWKASASADNHYAAWADQVAGKKGCKKGKARTTAQTAAGNTASGEASTQKITAAKLWNQIAKTYGLTERSRTQL
ncbi:hypothetical protein [Streptomyces sp. NPDC046909]|uniref:hypothetical protein n=1 Tax=Streptomyces sp. NPDC046909 TaxID=3155617 RepID=UPI0033C65877